MPKLTTDQIIKSIEKRMENMSHAHDKALSVVVTGLRPPTAYYDGAIDALRGLLEDIVEGVTDE